ncbi:MAG: hypothetical protein OXI81_10045 [Paracoccaceae bacterium]|nr:hypothetical protein [Paracoccaceae bacterium]MDE2912346.1 hypothetical protein [Paracoccaceae bacterium]
MEGAFTRRWRFLWQTLACGFGNLRDRLSNDLDILDQHEDQLAILVEVTACPSQCE